MIPAQLLAAYHSPVPSITSVSPSSGTTAGGTAMTLTGTGFLTTKTLSFGGNSVGSFTIVSDTSITFLSPAHAAGAVSPAATITTDGGGANGGSFTYSTPVVPGATTFNSGSGNYSVPAYNTLTIEIWGAGASGGVTSQANNGGNSTVSTYSLTAGGGIKSTATTYNTNQLGIGGTASGGNTTNTNGGNSTSPSPTNLGVGTSGAGGNSPNGGTGGAAVGGGLGTVAAGNAGNAPGGGGSGHQSFIGGPAGGQAKYPGGGAGAYVRHVFTFGAGGAPAVGASIAYAVGAGGTSSSSPVDGAGAAGRVRFTVA
jgi:hypothetical protein